MSTAVGGWSKKRKIMSTWLLNDPLNPWHFIQEFFIITIHLYEILKVKKKIHITIIQWCALENQQSKRGKMFPLFQQSFQRISGTKDTSFESPNIGRLEFAKKLGVASFWGWLCPINWKSTTFTRTRLEPFMTEILPVSVLLSNGTL